MVNPWQRVDVIMLRPGQSERLCRLPYPGHTKGCPNVGKKRGCPPNAPGIAEVLRLDEDVWAIWNGFDLASHVARMRGRQPDWSDRQLRCCLYWQPKARKELRANICRFLAAHRGLVVADTPEANGVNVTKTMKSIGIALEWPPRRRAYQIVLAGTPIVLIGDPAEDAGVKKVGFF